MIDQNGLRSLLDELGFSSKALIEDVSANELPNRKVFHVHGVGFAKVFAQSALDSFDRERVVLEDPHVSTIVPELRASRSLGEDGHLLLTAPAPGVVLDSVYQDLELGEYAAFTRSLGTTLARFHSLSTTGYPPFDELTDGDLPLHRKRSQEIATFPQTLDRLAELDLLSSATATVLRERVWPRLGSLLLDGDTVVIHADVHNENLFVERTGETCSCCLIDFEEAMAAPRELDFVHPFLNIVGEAFPERRFAGSLGLDHPIVDAFASGYSEIAGSGRFDIEKTGLHSLVWYLTTAVELAEEEEPYGFFLRTAIQAGIMSGLLPAGLPESKRQT